MLKRHNQVNWQDFNSVSMQEIGIYLNLCGDIFDAIEKKKDCALQLRFSELSVLKAYAQSLHKDCTDIKQSKNIQKFIKYLEKKQKAMLYTPEF